MMFGKKPVDKKRMKKNLQMSAYLGLGIEEIPSSHRSYGIVHDWGMLGNDLYGDCVFAGAAHEHMLWNLECGRNIPFNVKDVLADYGAVTGFDPKKPESDQGTLTLDALKYRQDVGIQAEFGGRRRIGAYAEIQVDEPEDMMASVYLLGIAAVGILCPSYIMDQLDNGEPWSVKKGKHSIEGGHYVPIVGYDEEYLYCVTWGQIQPMTWQFYHKFADEAYGIVSEDMLLNGKSPEGFELQQLLDDLTIIKQDTKPKKKAKKRKAKPKKGE